MKRDIKVTGTKVLEALRNSWERIVVLEGSARSSKTYSIIQFLILAALDHIKDSKEPLRILIARQRLTWLKQTLLVDFKNIMRDQFGLWNEKDFHKVEMIYRLRNAEFIFSGLDYESGQKFHGAQYDYAWFNEANEFDYPSVKQIIIRLKKRALMDYNPNMDDLHWIVTKILRRDDVRVIHSTYKDNPFLDQSVIDEIERLEPTPKNIEQGTADKTAWEIYGLGIRSVIKGLVYPYFEIIEKMPENLENLRYGLDFGFVNDPTALVLVGFKEGALYAQELLYEKNLTNIDNPKNPKQPSIERRFLELNINTKLQIFADSSEPKSIQDLRGCGFNVVPVKKGPTSIIDGINCVKRYKIFITEDSLNLRTELQRYKWLESRNDEFSHKPIDGYNHCLDALRYAVFSKDEEVYRARYAYDSCKIKLNMSKYG